MLPPRKWLWSLGLLAAAPVAATAGPLDVFKPKAETTQTAPAELNQKVAQDIAQALRQARLVGRDIDIEFLNGTARLTGQIADESQRAAATRIVSSVPGVRSVENRMTLMQDSPRSFSNSPIQQAGFEANGRAAIQPVEYQAAPNAAAPFPAGPSGFGPGANPQGYPADLSGQQVLEQSIPAQGASGNQMAAQRIAEAVSASGLRDYDVEIRFKDGVCTLVGTVDNQQQAISACEAAANVPGVQQVTNKLTVKGRPVSVGQQGPQTAQFNPYAQGPQGPVQPVAGQMPASPYGGPQGYGPGPQGYGPGPQGYGAPPPGYGTPAMPVGYGPAGHGVPPGAPMGGHGGGYGPGPHAVYNRPNLPDYAWPANAPYDNYAAVSYPSQYDASAFPYIGPFYPYPQVPLGWRKAQLVWDDGYWNLKFDSKTDRWWWFLNPENWH